MTETSAPEQLDRMITGYWISQAIYAAAKFDLAGHLKDGPRSVDKLAEATSTNAAALYRLLRALASVGVFAEVGPRRFAMTPLAEPLRDDVPGSKRALAMMVGDEQFRSWAEIDDSIQTGRTVFERIFGKPIFDYLSEHPDKASIFDQAMVGVHGREANAIPNAYDFSSIGAVVDIGGGNGSQIAAILKKHPATKGILFDLPHVVERAGRSLSPRALWIVVSWLAAVSSTRCPRVPTPTCCGTSFTIGRKKRRSRSCETAIAPWMPTAGCSSSRASFRPATNPSPASFSIWCCC